MIYLFEGLWYALLLIIKVCWIPVLIAVAIAIIARIIGKISRESKK